MKRSTDTNAFSRRRGRLAAILCGLVLLGIVLGLAEMLLRAFLPYNVVTIGHIYTSKADVYGWGFHPYELIRTHDPDTGEIHKAYTNNHGWRDRDRVVQNHTGAFRILALGDSHTFGPIVPADKTYTRILEWMLQEAGYRAEVINMAYGQWGTDQEIEALETEGIYYEPNLVVLQFCDNDLKDNTYFRWHENKALKPFYYDIDSTGQLVRFQNPYWAQKKHTAKDIARTVITKFELLKRCYGLYLRYQLRSLGPSAWTWQLTPEDPSAVSYTYTIDSTKIEHLEVVTEGRLPRLTEHLAGLIGKSIPLDRLEELIVEFAASSDRDAVLRILEDRWFPRWVEGSYWLAGPDSSAYEWRLYFALLGKAKDLTDSIGASLAILSDQELGLYEWRRYWCKISTGPQYRANFFEYSNVIRRHAESVGIGFIPNHHKHVRARNDPHPNLEGSRAMARNVFDYLFEHHSPELARYRIQDL